MELLSRFESTERCDSYSSLLSLGFLGLRLSLTVEHEVECVGGWSYREDQCWFKLYTPNRIRSNFRSDHIRKCRFPRRSHSE